MIDNKLRDPAPAGELNEQEIVPLEDPPFDDVVGIVRDHLNDEHVSLIRSRFEIGWAVLDYIDSNSQSDADVFTRLATSLEQDDGVLRDAVLIAREFSEEEIENISKMRSSSGRGLPYSALLELAKLPRGESREASVQQAAQDGWTVKQAKELVVATVGRKKQRRQSNRVSNAVPKTSSVDVTRTAAVSTQPPPTATRRQDADVVIDPPSKRGPMSQLIDGIEAFVVTCENWVDSNDNIAQLAKTFSAEERRRLATGVDRLHALLNHILQSMQTLPQSTFELTNVIQTSERTEVGS